MSTDRWRFARASIVGTSHHANGLPCQDYHACRVLFYSSGDPVLVAAVSDGAGSAKKADKGAEIVCQTLLEQVEVHVSSQRMPIGISADIGHIWFNAVRNAIAWQADEDQCELRDYACTMLLAVLEPARSLFMQIGDGAMVTSDNSTEWSWVFWPARGEFANTTYFVTDRNAPDHIKIETGDVIDEIALFTDGIEPLVLHYASRTVHSPFFTQIFAPVRTSSIAGEDADLSEQLRLYLDNPAINHRTNDDKTLVLATRWPASTSPTSDDPPVG
jgi:hypothetical protein